MDFTTQYRAMVNTYLDEVGPITNQDDLQKAEAELVAEFGAELTSCQNIPDPNEREAASAELKLVLTYAKDRLYQHFQECCIK